MKYDIYSNQLVLKQRFLRHIAFFNFTSFLNLFAIMRQKQKKPSYFAGLTLCSLSDFRKIRFELKLPGTILLVGLLIGIYLPSAAQDYLWPIPQAEVNINSKLK